jgi:hypothetical protein
MFLATSHKINGSQMRGSLPIVTVMFGSIETLGCSFGTAYAGLQIFRVVIRDMYVSLAELEATSTTSQVV